LAKDFSEKAIAGIKTKSRGLNADMHGSADYRAHLIGVMARRAVAAAK
jgi:aerobic carbon-monoxide dehydrogenase medium subunit